MKRVGQFVVGLIRDGAGAVMEWSWPRRLTVAAALAGFLAVTLFVEVPSIETLRAWAAAAGDPFIVLFWLGYVTIAQFPVPRTILTDRKSVV